MNEEKQEVKERKNSGEARAILKVLDTMVDEKKLKASIEREDYHRLIEGSSISGPAWARCGMTANEIKQEKEDQLFKKKVLKAK